jgi:hypothetical protein
VFTIATLQIDRITTETVGRRDQLPDVGLPLTRAETISVFPVPSAILLQGERLACLVLELVLLAATWRCSYK